MSSNQYDQYLNDLMSDKVASVMSISDVKAWRIEYRIWMYYLHLLELLPTEDLTEYCKNTNQNYAHDNYIKVNGAMTKIKFPRTTLLDSYLDLSRRVILVLLTIYRQQNVTPQDIRINEFCVVSSPEELPLRHTLICIDENWKPDQKWIPELRPRKSNQPPPDPPVPPRKPNKEELPDYLMIASKISGNSTDMVYIIFQVMLWTEWKDKFNNLTEVHKTVPVADIISLWAFHILTMLANEWTTNGANMNLDLTYFTTRLETHDYAFNPTYFKSMKKK